MPTTMVAAILVLTLFVPGYLAIVVFNRGQSWTPKPDLQLFATAVLVSAVCHLPTLWLVPTLLVWTQDRRFVEVGPVWVLMLWFLAVALVMPTALGFLASRFLNDPKTDAPKWVANTFALDRVGRAPTSWDEVWGRKQGAWIVVGLRSGGYLAGKWGTRSGVAFWKDGHDLFLEEEWTVTAEGRFDAESNRIEGNQGIWISGEAISTIRFVRGD